MLDLANPIADPTAFLLIAVWTLFWKAFSLWIAARRSHRVWFVVLLVLNTLGILDIVYIVFYGKQKNETVGDAMKSLLKGK